MTEGFPLSIPRLFCGDKSRPLPHPAAFERPQPVPRPYHRPELSSGEQRSLGACQQHKLHRVQVVLQEESYLPVCSHDEKQKVAQRWHNTPQTCRMQPINLFVHILLIHSHISPEPSKKRGHGICRQQLASSLSFVALLYDKGRTDVKPGIREFSGDQISRRTFNMRVAPQSGSD